jgi:dipeptidyl-peptidase-3
LNTRAWKNNTNHFTISVGSINTNGSESGIKFKNGVFDVQFGEFSAYLKEVNANLEMAMRFAANDNQKKMLQLYMNHFKTGNMSTHKDSQREWIKD